MDSITVGFSRPKSGFQPFSWLIRLVTWSPVSHTYIKFYSKTYQRWIIYQASGSKVNFIGAVAFDNAELVYKEFEIPVSTDTKNKTVEFAIDKSGLPYGMLQIVGIGWVLVAKLFGKNVSNPFYSTSSYFCSELLSTILNEIIDNKEDLNPGTATPADVMAYIETKGYKETI